MTKLIDPQRWADYVGGLDFKPLFVTVSGAHIYGFPSDNSDVDLRGCHQLPLEQVLGLNPPKQTIDRSSVEAGTEVDIVSHEISKYFGLLIKNNGYVLEQIFSPLVIQGQGFLDELKPIAAGCITRFHYHHYRGFYATQRRLIEKAERKTFKSVLYAYRVLMTGTHLMRTGRIETDVRVLNEDFKLPFLEQLIGCKVHEQATGIELEWDLHANYLGKMESAMEAAFEASKLPTDRDSAAVNDFLIRLRLDSRR